MAVSPARLAAFAVLMKVEAGAYSSEALHGDPSIESLTERDRGLVFELVLGTLRWQGVLDDSIRRTSGRPLGKMDPEVRAALRLGAYQIGFLDRIPSHAAVNDSVALVKRARKVSAAGFVNAILRRLPPGVDARKVLERSHPNWMVERWKARFGKETAQGILKAGQATPEVYLRLNLKYGLEDTLARLEKEGVETAETEWPWCRRVLRGRPVATECFAEGRVRVQDLGSQSIVPLLGLEAHHRFLDLCAAPGGKTYQAVESRRGSAGVVAADLHLHRLQTMRRLATLPVDMVVLDAEASLPFRSRFDRVLLDAPCSGTGTLSRNPEIRWRLKEHDLERLAALQKRILSRALGALAPGGVLVYSTCSLEEEENAQVIESVLAGRTQFDAGAYIERVPGREPGDGFFACRIERGSPVA